MIVAYKNPKVPNNIFIEKLSKVYDQILNKGKEIILFGDFNIDMLCKENILQNNLCDIYDLYNIVTSPTCFKKVEGSLVDPVIVRNKHRFYCHINLPCGYSDHHNMIGLITKLQVPPKKPQRIVYRNLKNFNEESYVKDIQNIPFHICSIFDDISDQCSSKGEKAQREPCSLSAFCIKKRNVQKKYAKE